MQIDQFKRPLSSKGEGHSDCRRGIGQGIDAFEVSRDGEKPRMINVDSLNRLASGNPVIVLVTAPDARPQETRESD